MQPATLIDDQPISATFFGEGRWLTDFVTPNALDIQALHKDITEGLDTLDERLVALHDWVACNIKYTRFVKGKLWVGGKSSAQDDLWSMPSITARVKIGNCANMSFLLASLVRNELPANQVYCVLGNLYNGKPGGHCWVQARLRGADYIMESTRADAPPMVPVTAADRYEVVHLFNDQEAYAIEGKTVMEPFTMCYSTWLRDYLDWAYIKGRKG